MNVKDAIVKAMQEYRQITGLRSYLIQDVDDINSAAEHNYFCKCLKTSARALKHCEECIADRGGGQLFFCAVEKLLIGMLLMYAQNIDLIAVTQDVTVLPGLCGKTLRQGVVAVKSDCRSDECIMRTIFFKAGDPPLRKEHLDPQSGMGNAVLV